MLQTSLAQNAGSQPSDAVVLTATVRPGWARTTNRNAGPSGGRRKRANECEECDHDTNTFGVKIRMIEATSVIRSGWRAAFIDGLPDLAAPESSK